MNSRAFPTVLVFTLQLCGCDFYNGVTRSYNLKSTVEFSCVESVLESHPNIAEIKYSIEDGGRELTWTGIQPPDEVHRFSYRLTNTEFWPSFYFHVRYNGAIEYHHSLLCLNCTPPQADVDLVRPFMTSIENQLEKSCAVSGISTAVSEYCRKVDCGDT